MHICRITNALLVALNDLGTWPSALQLLTATERRHHIGQDRKRPKDRGQKVKVSAPVPLSKESSLTFLVIV